MSLSVRRPSLCCLALVLAFLGAFLGSAAAQSQSRAPLDKHARKVHHKLAKYSSGKYLHLVLANNTNAYGALGTLSEASFTFTSSDSNTTATYSYDNINKVRTDREIIGPGAEPHHIRHLVPILITAAALGTGAIVYEAER